MDEKIAMSDGRFDQDKLIKSIDGNAREALLIDMDALAKQSGSIVNSVMLGAIAGTGMLPLTVEQLEAAILPHNIGYLKLGSFPDVSACQQTARAAMASLNATDALIFDLRGNRGGEPAMVMLLAAYLFNHPEYMYNPRENTTEQSWTRSPVLGNRLADKPAYILVSGTKASAAEHFSYDLKMLKRATIVGETTAGTAHSGVWHRIDDHFGMGIPETKAINPFSASDWAEVGVKPDIRVKSDDALQTAVTLARKEIAQR